MNAHHFAASIPTSRMAHRGTAASQPIACPDSPPSTAQSAENPKARIPERKLPASETERVARMMNGIAAKAALPTTMIQKPQ